MDIIRENAGGRIGRLILESNGEFLVQGVKTVGAAASVLAGEPLRVSVACSKGIVNYVLRTSELVVLDDAAQHGKFRNDPYLRNRRPKSMLCAPVAHKGKLIGAVYLENNQVAGAFTPDRLEALNILMAQMAVSIENATLYARQEQQSRAIEAANVTLTKEIAERKRAEGELSRYKDHLEDLVKERTRELEKAHEALKQEAACARTRCALGESNEQIRALAYQDGLTGLPNRRLFNEHLEKVLARARRKGTEFAVLFIDIDNFKLINDTIGHQAADEVLRQLADSLALADSHRRRARPVPRRARSTSTAHDHDRADRRLRARRVSAATSSSSCCPTRAIDSRPARSRGGSCSTSSSRSASMATRCSSPPASASRPIPRTASRARS